MAIDIKLDSPELKALVAEAVLRTIDDKARDALITAAIEHLVTPQAAGYGRGPGKTPLQDLFDNEISRAAREIVAERMKDDPRVKAMIHSLIDAAIAKVEAQGYSTISDGLANMIGEALSKAGG